MKNRTPDIIAHRGANKKAPQNTIPAFSAAIEDGCDGFETDVHLSKDGVPVICHNYTVDATSDGKGEIPSFTLKELKLLDFGSYFSEDFRGTPLPTLSEFLDLAVDGGVKIINIEIKCPKTEGEKLVIRTLEEIRKHGCMEKVIISSFSPNILKMVKKYAAECKTAYLYPTNDPDICLPVFSPFLVAKSCGADIIHPMAPLVSRALVMIAHRLGMKVNVWTVDDRVSARYLAACGVDGLITDKPKEVREYLKDKK